MSGINAKLVDALFWREGGLNYRAFVRVKGGKFFFEGRVRYPGGEHEYFPRKDWHTNSIGKLKEAKAVVASQLSANGCPKKDIEHALGKMDTCQ